MGVMPNRLDALILEPGEPEVAPIIPSKLSLEEKLQALEEMDGEDAEADDRASFAALVQAMSEGIYAARPRFRPLSDYGE